MLATAVGYIFTRCPPSLNFTKHELAAPLDVVNAHGKYFLKAKLMCGAKRNVLVAPHVAAASRSLIYKIWRHFFFYLKRITAGTEHSSDQIR